MVASRIIDRIAAKLRTYWQRFFKDLIVDRAVLEILTQSGVGVGWSIGPTFKGRFYDAQKKVLYPERSFYVEVLDAPYPLLKTIAEKLRRAFKQQEVILKSYDTGETEHIQEQKP